MMKKLVIFDLDGTLLDTIEDLAVSANYALRECGYPLHDVSEYPRFVGNGISKLIERALPVEARNADEIARVMQVFMSYYDEHSSDYTRPYAGVEALLDTLHKRGMMLAVASNKYHSATIQIVKHYFPTIPFVAVLGQRDDVPKKPHPAIVHEILATAQVEACEAIYVGDSDVDMHTASSAGVESVGVTWGFRSEENLREAGACHIIHHADNLLQWV